MKLGVCVPYRNREAHLKEFVPRVGKYLDDHNIDYHMYFGHQVDEKLFNRGAMKNIAAEWAFNEGCDYIVWHDIDMIPQEGCDYSFPEKYPVHIATNLSQNDFMLKYEEYFGGAVIFSKEQVLKTNGYSNDYWDWGMEDDDLFWRCVLEGYADEKDLDYEEERDFISFNGKNSYITIPCTNSLRSATATSHTVSILVRAHQQEEKVPIWLVGDEDRRFCEYPIFRRPGYDYGISYNNSRAFTMQMWTGKGEHLYQWIKRYENKWSWVTLVVDGNNIHFYLNGKESDARWGTGSPSPISFDGRLKRYGKEDYYIGTTTSVDKNDVSRWFKGDIADIKMWNRALTKNEVKNLHKTPPHDGLIIHYDMKNGILNDKSFKENHAIPHNISVGKDKIKIPFSVLPHRRPGKMECLPHKNEGLIKNEHGKEVWAKGKTTARNERRYVLEMQKGEWNYKDDGFKQLKYNFVEEVIINSKAKLINVTL